MQRGRLGADRIRRVWSIVEYVAAHPGLTRRALAERFAIAERTLQGDLITIRHAMGLPLVRRGGYRFATPSESAAPPLGLGDVYVLADALRLAACASPSIANAVRGLRAKLPALFPPHLRPLLVHTLARVTAQQFPTTDIDPLAVVAQATQLGHAVRLGLAADHAAGAPTLALIHPEAVLPYGESWYLIGQCPDSGRSQMLDLADVLTADLMGDRTPT